MLHARPICFNKIVDSWSNIFKKRDSDPTQTTEMKFYTPLTSITRGDIILKSGLEGLQNWVRGIRPGAIKKLKPSPRTHIFHYINIYTG